MEQHLFLGETWFAELQYLHCRLDLAEYLHPLFLLYYIIIVKMFSASDCVFGYSEILMWNFMKPNS